MSGHDDGLVRQRQHGAVQRLHDLFVRATRQVGAANRSREQRISRDQLLLGREIQADAALGVTRRMQNFRNQATRADLVARAEAGVDHDLFRRAHADPSGLHGQHLQQGIIVLVQQNRRAGQPLQLGRSTHVINVRVGDDDLLHRQPVALHDRHHIFDVIAGIDDHGFFRLLIADHRAIALQRADREDLVDHGSKLPRSGLGIHMWRQALESPDVLK